MIPEPRWVHVGTQRVGSFSGGNAQQDRELVEGFGEEWVKFHSFSPEDLERIGAELFDLWPGGRQGRVDAMLDVGCGSGRWSRYLADRCAHIDALDPSDAVLKAAVVHQDIPHIRWSRARAEALPFPDRSFDMVLLVGVLHHLPEPQKALAEARRVLREGGHLYFYVYYAMEQRSAGYRALFKASDLLRRAVHRLPGPLERAVCEVLAAGVYLPLVSLARASKGLGLKGWHRLPLAYYHDKSYRIMRNDALDRFGTSRERRYTREEVEGMLTSAGFTTVRFSPGPPYWHGIATTA